MSTSEGGGGATAKVRSSPTLSRCCTPPTPPPPLPPSASSHLAHVHLALHPGPLLTHERAPWHNLIMYIYFNPLRIPHSPS